MIFIVFGYRATKLLWGSSDGIRRLIASGSFEPEQSAAMISAYDAACTVLRLTDIDDPLTELIATAIVEVASTGERDPILLAGKALVALGLREPPG